MRGFKTLENKYGVSVVEEGEFYHPLKRYWIKTYKIVAADGCVWEKGLHGRDAVKREILAWGDHLLKIKEGTARIHNVSEAYADILKTKDFMIEED